MNALEKRQDIGYCCIAAGGDDLDGDGIADAVVGIAGGDVGVFVADDIAGEMGAMVEHAEEGEREQSLFFGKTVMVAGRFELRVAAEMETCRLTVQTGG